MDAAGNETEAWPETLEVDLNGLRVSPDGRRAAVIATDGNGVARNEVFDLDAGTRVRIGRVGQRMFEPFWSPNGERIAVELLHQGEWQLATFPPRPNEAAQILTSGRAMDERFPGGFTPDGRSLLFTQWSMLDKLGDLFLVDLEGGAQPRPFLTGPGQEFAAALSPDGRWAAFLSSASDRTEIWVTDFPTARSRWHVSAGMMTLADASADEAWSESGWGWLSGDELWWTDEKRRLVAARIEERGGDVEVVSRRPLLGARTLTEDEGILDYSFARRRFLLKRNIEPATVPDIIFISDWRAALDAANAKP